MNARLIIRLTEYILIFTDKTLIPIWARLIFFLYPLSCILSAFYQ